MMNEPLTEAELRHLAATRAGDGVKELLIEAADLTAQRLQARKAAEQGQRTEASHVAE